MHPNALLKHMHTFKENACSNINEVKYRNGSLRKNVLPQKKKLTATIKSASECVHHTNHTITDYYFSLDKRFTEISVFMMTNFNSFDWPTNSTCY